MDGSLSDAMLLAAVGEHDLDAMRALYDRHAGWLSVRLARRCNDPDMVADAVQDTFVAVWRKPRGFRGDGDVAAWLWGIAIRRLLSRLRTRTDIAAVLETSQLVPAAEDQVLLSVEYGDIGQALARLSPEMRAVIQAVVAAAAVTVLMYALTVSGGWDHPVVSHLGQAPVPIGHSPHPTNR